MLNETERLYGEVRDKFEKAVKLFYEKKFKEAKKLFSEVGKEFPRHREFRERAEVFLRIIEKMEASQGYEETREDKLNRVVGALNEKDPEYALEILKELKEKDARVFYLEALAYALLEKEKEAIEKLKKAVELEPRFKVLAKKEPDLLHLREKGLLDQL